MSNMLDFQPRLTGMLSEFSGHVDSRNHVPGRNTVECGGAATQSARCCEYKWPRCPTLRRNQRRLARNQTPELVDGANGETERERIIQTKEGDFVPIVVDIGHRAPHQISKLLGSFCSATIHLSGKESKAELFGHLGSG
jgi:hypothetical protein